MRFFLFAYCFVCFLCSSSCTSAPKNNTLNEKNEPNTSLHIQAKYSPYDSIKISNINQQYSGCKLSTGNIIASIAKEYIGTPYMANTLEGNSAEQLVINIKELDCTTLVEYVLASALLAKKENPSFNNYKETLCQIRYRDGAISDYSSRLHYFSDWLCENIEKGRLSFVNNQFLKPYKKEIRFMSANKQLYPALKDDSLMVARIMQIESNLLHKNLQYVPKNDIHKLENIIKDGDIIAICTNIKLLDISHVGFAVWQNNETHLLHASSKKNEVVISQETLAEYLANSKLASGIIIARAID